MRLPGPGLLVVVAMLASMLSSCGGDDSGEKDQDADKDKGGLAGAADQTVCAADATAVAAPYDAEFPTAWTFPPQTVVYNVEDRTGAGVIVTGVTTSPFEDVLTYLNQDVTQAGFSFVDGETEDDDAESNWTSQGYTGRWTIRKSGTCAGQTVIQVLATPAG